MIYFTSDLHFYHKNAIKYCNRPYSSLEEMNDKLIANWNAKVSMDDEVYVLGDLVLDAGAKEANDILRQLNGKKYLIRGNHDEYVDDPTFDVAAFEWIKDYHVIRDVYPNIVLFHYPILEWEGWYKGNYHLYGHTHEDDHNGFNGQLKHTAVNVGVDANNYAPISLDEVKAIIKHRE